MRKSSALDRSPSRRSRRYCNGARPCHPGCSLQTNADAAARDDNDLEWVLICQRRPPTLGAVAPSEKLQIPFAPGGIVVESASPSEIPVPRKMAAPTIEVPDAGAAPSEKCQRGNPLLAS